jgi:hypothetical protein
MRAWCPLDELHLAVWLEAVFTISNHALSVPHSATAQRQARAGCVDALCTLSPYELDRLSEALRIQAEQYGLAQRYQ